MKNLFVKIIFATAAILLFAVNAEAKRPVWVIAHGANWKYSIEDALKEGANGVEVDVREGTTFWNWFNWHSTRGNHWCLGHDTYWDEEHCDNGNDAAVSLQWVLTGYVTKGYTTKINDDPRFCVLWLDVKDEGYIKELVKYVHTYTERYGTNYTIIYNIYENLDDETLSWLRGNLWDHELMNWADKSISELKKSQVGSEWPKITGYHHFFTRGIFNVNQPQNTSTRWPNIKKAKDDRSFCRRAGVWSNVTANNATAWIKYGVDVVLTYYDKGYRPTLECQSDALKELVYEIHYGSLLPEVYIATRQDKF